MLPLVSPEGRLAPEGMTVPFINQTATASSAWTIQVLPKTVTVPRVRLEEFFPALKASVQAGELAENPLRR